MNPCKTDTKKDVFMEYTNEKLIQMALDARKNAYTPYSHYQVGAALLCEDGTVFTGCNIESASYPCGICGERTAASKAISEGHIKFKKIAIAGSSAQICTPCGLCRQFLYEFAPNLEILCVNNSGEYKETTLDKLLADGFGASSL